VAVHIPTGTLKKSWPGDVSVLPAEWREPGWLGVSSYTARLASWSRGTGRQGAAPPGQGMRNAVQYGKERGSDAEQRGWTEVRWTERRWGIVIDGGRDRCDCS